jgi:2-polyprenyl-6-methoxyphenol hydroxylase-like FAD-dependent oxidoreductase
LFGTLEPSSGFWNVQGGCTALEDGIVLARMLYGVWSSGSESDLEKTLREFEKQRSIRCFKLAVRSNLIGKALQSSNPFVVAARDIAVQRLVNPKNFFNHALYDCGGLPVQP